MRKLFRIGCLAFLGVVALIVVISVAMSSGKNNAPASPTLPSQQPAASTPSGVSAACQLIPVIKAKIKAGHYDTAQRDAGHAENLASKAGDFTQSADFNSLALDLINFGSGVDTETVSADLATLADDCGTASVSA